MPIDAKIFWCDTSPTRLKLRRAVRAVNQVLGALRLERHPDKTFIGRIEKGFDFLGYHFGTEGLTMAADGFRPVPYPRP